MPRGILPGFEPRRADETDYQYRNRRSIFTTGKSLYQRRIEKGLSSGLTVSEARGHGSPVNITEAAYTRTSVIDDVLTYVSLRKIRILQDAAASGYTTQTTGLSTAQLADVWPLIKKMNTWASEGGQLTPQLILDAEQAEKDGELEPGWTYTQIREKYQAMEDYHTGRIRAPADIRGPNGKV